MLGSLGKIGWSVGVRLALAEHQEQSARVRLSPADGLEQGMVVSWACDVSFLPPSRYCLQADPGGLIFSYTAEATHTPPPPARGWGLTGVKYVCHSGVLTVRHDVQHGVP